MGVKGGWMASEPQRERLPFEPVRSRKKTAKSAKSTAPAQPSASSPKGTAQPDTSQRSTARSAQPTAKPKPAGRDQSPAPAVSAPAATRIPDAVSNRMIRRMVIFCGIPTSLGISTFIGSYLIVSHEWFPLPNVAVVIASMGCFGLGVLGLSYGVLSASWDEAVAGSWLGWDEFTTNTGRMVSAWRSARKPKA